LIRDGVSDEDLNMTMLTYAFERPSPSSEGGDVVQTGAGNARRAMIKQFFLCALGALTATVILAGIIALETAFYLRALID
jgi:hypothetical protein